MIWKILHIFEVVDALKDNEEIEDKTKLIYGLLCNYDGNGHEIISIYKNIKQINKYKKDYIVEYFFNCYFTQSPINLNTEYTKYSRLRAYFELTYMLD